MGIEAAWWTKQGTGTSSQASSVSIGSYEGFLSPTYRPRSFNFCRTVERWHVYIYIYITPAIDRGLGD